LIPIIEYRLKLEREKKGWSQKYIAENTGIPSSNISRYETGERKPDIETLLAMADFLGCSVDYLLGRTDEPSPSMRREAAELEELLRRYQPKLRFRGRTLSEEEVSDLIRVAGIIFKERGRESCNDSPTRKK